jgi:hypothetical protein
MRLVDLAFLYGAAGLVCGVTLYRRAERHDRAALVNALTAIPLWPLWAPIVWSEPRRSSRSGSPDASHALASVRTALDEAVISVRGSPLEQLLNRDLADAIWKEIERVAARETEVRSLLSQDEFDRDAASLRLAALEREGASPRALGSARLHLDNVDRLATMARSDARTLSELGALVIALRTELVVARLSGSSSGAVDDIVNDLWAQIQGLSQANQSVSAPEQPA